MMPSSRRGNNAGPPNPKKKKRTQQVAAPAAAVVLPPPAHLPTDETPTDAAAPPPQSIPPEDSSSTTSPLQTKKMSLSSESSSLRGISDDATHLIETNGCKEEDPPKAAAPTSEVVPNHTDSPQGGGGGRERIVVAIKANSSIVVDAKSLRHSGSKRHKKSASGDPSSFSSSSKKSSKERKSKRNSPSISFSSNTPSDMSEPVLENQPIKISIANSTPSITITTTNSTPAPSGSKKTDKLKTPVSDKWEKQEKNAASSTPANSTLPSQLSTPASSKSTRSTSSSSPNTSSSSSVNTTPSSLTTTPTARKEMASMLDTAYRYSTKKKGQARIKVTPTASERNSSGRASKRPRLQYQPYQAPSTEASQYSFFKSPHNKSAEDKIMVFGKGEFLAVRNENGGFYVCRTAQNVYKSSRRFKIQWLNSGKEPNTYTPDFYDTTDFECVLTNLRMKRVDKNVYLLPEEETKRTMNILQRALNVESGMDKPDPHQVALDGVDVSIVGKEEEEEIIKKQRDLEIKKQQELAATKTKTKLKKEKLEEEPPAKKIKIISSEAAAKSEEKKPPKAPSVPTPTKRKHLEKLKPNLEITVVEKDPTFESTIQVPFVSSTAHSRLLIRAVLLKDLQLLQSLLSDTQNICSIHFPRSLHIKRTALSYAIKMENHQAIKVLLDAPTIKYASPPDILLSEDSTGSYNPMMLGHGIRSITIARGGKEGNNALIKDNDSIHVYPSVEEEDLTEALREGVSISTLRLLCKKSCYNMRSVYSHIVEAIRYGHHKLAGQLVAEALENGGFGFNHLHKEALLNTKQNFSPFKTISVTKKATDNARITPLHCASINPNSRHLATLLSHAPEYQLADRDSWLPIHYAAVCKSTAPLELLLSRGISTEEVNSHGNTPLHVACLAGRHRNVGTLLSHASIICDQAKTEDNSFLLSQYEKYGVGGINRPNNKSFTPLHLAVQNGHLDVVKVLLSNSVDIEKPTSANQDKLTPLMIAAQQGHFKIAKLLVNHGAMVEAHDKKHRTALTYAVMNGNTNLASYLLHLGADPNTVDSSGNSLIHYACAYGWHFCLQLLIEAGANPNTPNDWKLVPLTAAFMKGHIGLVNYLVEQPGVDVNLSVNHDTGMTLLMQTVKVEKMPNYHIPKSPLNASMLERIKFLIEKLHIDCTKLDFSGNNALHYLVETEAAFLKYLSSQRKTLDEKEDESMAPCRGIVGPGHEGADFLLEEMKKEHDVNLENVVQILLKNDCKPSIKNIDGETPFSLALKNGCLALVKMFLDNGCGLTFTVNTSTGNTILHYLVEQVADVEVESVWKAIMKANSPMSPPEDSVTILHKMTSHYNKEGFTPLLYALHFYSANKIKPKAQNLLLKFIKLLMDDLSADCTFPLKNNKDQVVGSALHLAVKESSGALVKLLLTKRPPLDPLDLDSRTPLVAAICNGNFEAAEHLIQAGANLSVKSPKDDGLPPLLLACREEGMTKVIQLLIQNKAPLHVANPKNGNTALHYLVSQTKKDADTVKLVKSLLLSIDVNTPNHRHQTPLHLCVQQSTGGTDAYYGVEELLLASKAKTEALDHAGRTPLHYAFSSLLDESHTPSNYEVTSKDPIELVTLLLNYMSNQSVSIQDAKGQTPLHLAAACGATISVIHLMQKSNNVEMKDKDGNTALGLAIMNGHQSTVLIMLQKNASCIADLVKIAAKDTTFLPHAWYWEHLLKPPRPSTKITILQETVRRDWQSILYIMLDQLEANGKGFTVAIEAALMMASYNLALKLIGRVKHNWTLYSERQSTLHMLARHAPADRLLDQQLKVANALIEKGVPVMARDEHGCSVLTYAAVNWNHTLFNFFADKVGITSAAQADPDKSLRTPLTAFFWRLKPEDFLPPVRACCEALLTNAANVDLLTQFPFRESPYPGIRCVANMDEIHQESASAPRLSPLLVAVYRQNYPVVKFLLQNGADVNFADDLHRTPLMHAARLHDLKMVKLLLNYDYEPEKDTSTEHRPGTIVIATPVFKQTSPADLTRRDVHGYTVLHHAICPSVDFGYHHTALVNFLVHAGVPTDVPNNDGDTPLQMAQNAHAVAMVNVLYDWMNVAPELREIPSKPSPTAANAPPLEPPSWNWKEDYISHLEKLDAESEDKSLAPIPDYRSKLQDSGEVVFDNEKDLPYDVVLTNVDLRYRHAGLYNFYKMQVLRQKERNLALLFTRWGRVGDVGQYQRTPFPSTEAAISEFCKIFKSKTGNAWENVKTFKALPKKYRLVAQEKRVQTQKKLLLPQKLVSEVPSQLSQPISDLFHKLVDVHLKQNSWDHLSVQPEAIKMTFGRLSDEILQKAENILNQINALLVKKSDQERDLIDPDPFTYNQIIELSEEFYHLVPVFGYEYEKLEPLFSQHNVDSMMRLLDNIRHISLAAEVILGAYHKASTICPMDYIYRSISCHIELLPQQSTDAQMILQYLYNTSNACIESKRKAAWDGSVSESAESSHLPTPPHVTAIYRLQLPHQTNEASFDGDSMMLWHGTVEPNLLGILHRGLQIAPLGSSFSGAAFGKGIYFSDMFEKSHHYCGNSETKYVLLCEVSLGVVKYHDKSKDSSDKDVKYDTLKVIGNWIPDPLFTVSYQGVLWPMGSSISSESPGTSYWRDYSEYVVKSPAQVQLRYLVQIGGQSPTSSVQSSAFR